MSTIVKDVPPVTLMPPVDEPEALPPDRPTRVVKAIASTRHLKEKGGYESTSFIAEVRKDVRRQRRKRVLKTVGIATLVITLLVPLGVVAYSKYVDATEEQAQ
jgi:hypothetical protein